MTHDRIVPLTTGDNRISPLTSGTDMALPFDPFPYVSVHNSRHAFSGTLDGKPLVWAPREGYEQDCTAYGIF